VLDGAPMVAAAVEGLTNAINVLVSKQQEYAGTAVIGAYPGGAGCMGYTIANDSESDAIKRRVFKALRLKFPGTNPDAAYPKRKLMEVV
jgi:hypothetical protein